ncbi:MAG: HAD family hydrolase [Acidobacteriota bacterium]|jgi:FMN hydrolase / 5-amino-6-(5-phospho-D-ribitylamino)uracil phosphatase
MLKTIFFDGDDTLWDFHAATRRCLGIVLEDLRRALPGERTAAMSVEDMMRIRDDVAAEVKGRIVDLGKVRLMAFERTVQAAGGADGALAARLNALYFRHRHEKLFLFPDALPVLQQLAERFKIGLISNGNTVPSRHGLGHLFRMTLYSTDVGYAKPHPAFFRQALKNAGSRAEDCLVVGDSLEDDVRGAHEAGIRAVWLNRRGRRNTSGIEPEGTIGSLRELPALCDAMAG